MGTSQELALSRKWKSRIGRKNCVFSSSIMTLPETNSKFAPENGWLKDEIFRMAYLFRGHEKLSVSITPTGKDISNTVLEQ